MPLHTQLLEGPSPGAGTKPQLSMYSWFSQNSFARNLESIKRVRVKVRIKLREKESETHCG